ncbi:MAG: GNAT family N-acetyltransferase [Rhodobacteraceae bacterium]|nr:GNAT family N-acetyltransferase [Paracoccaceae bacterium]
MSQDLRQWSARPFPTKDVFEGSYARLEKLSVTAHLDDLFEASSVEDAGTRFAWLPDYPPKSIDEMKSWMDTACASSDPLHYAVIDKALGKVAGRQALMRIDAANGVAEIGNIYWGPLISRSRTATEAFYLFAQHVFNELGYRRFEWKCNNRNGPSKAAALRFGFQFEGIFRNHLVVKGENRDTAWYSITDDDWSALQPAYDAWLSPDNFDESGHQKNRLQDIR